MIRRVLTAYSIEIGKALRLWSTYLGPGLVLLAVLAAFAANPLRRDGESDYHFIAYAAPLSINVLGLFMVLIHSAGLISGELGQGTIRMVLVRPLRRREFLLAKYGFGVTYAVLLSAIAAGAIWALTLAFGDLGGIRYGSEVLFTDDAMRRTFIVAFLLGLVPQFAVVAFGLFVSTCTRSTGAAVGAAIGLWLLMDIAKYPLGIAPFVFSSYMETAWQVFADRCNALDADWAPTAYYAVATSAASALIFLTGAMYVLSRRNLCS